MEKTGNGVEERVGRGGGLGGGTRLHKCHSRQLNKTPSSRKARRGGGGGYRVLRAGRRTQGGRIAHPNYMCHLQPLRPACEQLVFMTLLEMFGDFLVFLGSAVSFG